MSLNCIFMHRKIILTIMQSLNIKKMQTSEVTDFTQITQSKHP